MVDGGEDRGNTVVRAQIDLNWAKKNSASRQTLIISAEDKSPNGESKQGVRLKKKPVLPAIDITTEHTTADETTRSMYSESRK